MLREKSLMTSSDDNCSVKQMTPLVTKSGETRFCLEDSSTQELLLNSYSLINDCSIYSIDLPSAAELAKDFYLQNEGISEITRIPPMKRDGGAVSNKSAPIPSPLNPKIQGKKRGRPKRDKKLGWPKRPLSAYNIFFKEYRLKLLGIDDQALPEQKKRTFPNKRRHKKHGLITFDDLAKTIASKWKSLKAYEKVRYEEKAKIYKQEYDNEMKVFRKENFSNNK